MALSQADFYAYSRATGAPIPEDPRERAEMAPKVLAFRRNQLKAPEQQGPDPISVGIGVGLALAGAGGALFGARRLMGGRKQAANTGVRVADIERVTQEAVAQEPIVSKVSKTYTPEPSKSVTTPSPSPSVVTTEQYPDPWQTSEFTPRSFIEKRGSVAPVEDLTTKQKLLKPALTDQTYEAVESGANQQQIRISLDIQRDEDLDISSAQRFLQRERDEIASELGEQNITITPSKIEQELANRLGKTAYIYGPKYSARKQALELYAQTGAPTLLERVQRFGLSPASFETFETMPAAKQVGFENAPPLSTSYYPSEELFAKGLTSNINVNLPTRGQISIAEFRKPVITESTAQQAEEYYQTKKGEALDWLGNLRVQLEPKRNQILKERQLLVEQSAQELIPQLEAAKQAGRTDLVSELEQNLNTLRTIWQNPRLGTYRANELYNLDQRIAGAQNKIQESITGIQKKYPTTIADWSGESARIFGELDTETGELIPESLEIRGDRPSVLKEPKGGGGRNIAEYTAGERLDEEIRAIQGGGRIRDYDPETGAAYQPWTGDRTQTGREIDIYGIRPSGEKRADPTKIPSEPQYTKQEIMEEAMRLSQADPYGDVPIAPEYSAVVESIGAQEPTPEAKRAVLMSEALRKAERLRAERNPRGGVLPDEITMLRRQIAQLDEQQMQEATSRIKRVPRTYIPPQQLTLPGVTGYKARQVKSSADIAADQLEDYMSKLQRGRSVPLTSAVRIQPSLF